MDCDVNCNQISEDSGEVIKTTLNYFNTCWDYFYPNLNYLLNDYINTLTCYTHLQIGRQRRFRLLRIHPNEPN